MAGGNMNSVHRVGETVERSAGPWTPTIHAYLDHLAGAGISEIPRPIAVRGDTEVLSFVEGEVPLYPLPAFVWTDRALRDAATLLRRIHDASETFDRREATWQLPSHEPIEVICHNDFAPHNLAFVDGRVVGAIDFDTASPGPRLWDIAYLATRMIPLTAEYPLESPPEKQSRRRIQLLLDAYGSGEPWTAVIGTAIVRLRELAEFTRGKAVELDKRGLWDDAAMYESDAVYLRAVLDSPP
jgi:hypothetical protein